MHVAIALTLLGQRVATIDLDSRQKSFTRYIDNRRAWARHARLNLKLPVHFCVARGTTLKLDENESIEFASFAEAVSAVERSHDFIVVDTPGTDSYLTRLAHSMADTLITPLNDSFVDLDVIGAWSGKGSPSWRPGWVSVAPKGLQNASSIGSCFPAD
jgi:chromosome partitioning protein